MKAAEMLLGTPDLLIDSVSLSVQWPGDAPFGPHVDRPIQASDSTGKCLGFDFRSPIVTLPLYHPFLLRMRIDNWPYSARFREGVVPPLLSVQAIWCLDAFTVHNGAFFVDGNSAASGRRTVLTRAGDVIVANGGVQHGAHANRECTPRIAVLVQYVPRFVRPGAQFPRAVLDLVHQQGEFIGRLERLLDLCVADDDPALTVSVEKSPGVPGIFVPPWSAAQAVAGAVVQAEIERFCGTGVNSVCALSLEEEVYRMALLKHHGGSGPCTTPSSLKLKEVPGAPHAKQQDPQTNSFLLSNGITMPALAFGTGGRSADEVSVMVGVAPRHVASLFLMHFFKIITLTRFCQHLMWGGDTLTWLKVMETKPHLEFSFGALVCVLQVWA